MISSKIASSVGQIGRALGGYAVQSRNCSTKKLVDTNINEKTGIATVTMNRGPVNSLNLELLTEISNALDSVQSNKCLGMVLASSSSVFSAGLDIMEMYKPTDARLRQFWTALQV